MRFAILIFLIGLAATCYGQQPDVTAQRVAMRKLEFLVGSWTGDATVSHGPGEPQKLKQAENVRMALDGLVMIIEGTGRDDLGHPVFNALATISFDDATSKYHFRAYNEGRYLDTELTMTPNGFVWGFADGPLKATNTMHLNDAGEWAEVTETTYGSTPPHKSVEMTLHKERQSTTTLK
jgi:hypothetical protein